MKKLFQILTVTAICLLFKPVNLCYSQNDVCKKFEFVNESANSYIPFSPLKSKKAKLESQYNFVCSYDFNGDGSAEEIYSRLDQQSVGLLLESKNDNIENYKFYIDDGMPESEDEGIWIFIVDVVGDETPEIVAFSFFRSSSVCSLSIIKYDKVKGSFIQKDYGLNELVLDQHMLVKNKKVIVNSYGSQGLFDEIPFSDEDFGGVTSSKKEYSQTGSPHFKIAENVDGERITYIKPIKCVEINLIKESDANNVFSYDIDNDGFDERISYRTFEGDGFIIRFKIEGTNPDGGIVHEFDLHYDAAEVGEQDFGVWLYLADVYGDTHPEVLAFSYFYGDTEELTISTYSGNRFIDRNFPLTGEDVLYIKNQKIVRDYSSNGTFKTYAFEQYNLKIKNDFSSLWFVYVDDYYCGMVGEKETKIFNVPFNIYQKIICKQFGADNPIELIWTRDKKPTAGQDVNCNIDIYFLQIANTHSDPRNVYVDGYYFGQVPGYSTKKIEVLTAHYREIILEQSKGYLISPNIETFSIPNRPNANTMINIKN